MNQFRGKILIVVVAIVFGIVEASPVPDEDTGDISSEILSGPFGPADCFKDATLPPYSCAALFWRFKWSDEDKDCIKVVFGGCRESKNNFLNKEECLKVAGPVCKPNTL